MPKTQARRIKRALLSVSDKTGIADFAACLHSRGVEILSTAATARLLSDSGIAAADVSGYTGFPEIMGGRVKTLHPKIHGALLGRRDEDAGAMSAHGIEGIDLLAVNLYPFVQTIAQPGCTPEQAIENIDVGGPAMIRAAAKNHRWVTVVVEPADYAMLQTTMEENDSCIPDEVRFALAAKAFAHVAAYDDAVSAWFSEQAGTFPHTWAGFRHAEDLRYGENPQQQAALYRGGGGGIANARQLQGKPLSYNNCLDADAAVQAVCEFEDRPACVIVKHTNPCGAACADTLRTAFALAQEADPVSAFGGIIAFNRRVDADTARTVIGQQLVEVIVAPELDEAAAAALRGREKLRVLVCDVQNRNRGHLDCRSIGGGLLVQQKDEARITAQNLETVTRCRPGGDELRDLLFAWRVAKHVKSNAIVYAGNERTIGIGAGQMSRIDAARIAADKARRTGRDPAGAVMASDAFFPFPDAVVLAHELGIRAIIQPGGSVKDKEVIAAADEHGIAMVFTGLRHFKH